MSSAAAGTMPESLSDEEVKMAIYGVATTEAMPASIASVGEQPSRGKGRPPLTPCAVWSLRILILTYCLVAVLIACAIWQLSTYTYEEEVFAWGIAAMAVGIAVPISLYDIGQHMSNFVSPLQTFYIRMLWMVPIFSIESWLALRFHEQGIYLETVRECYEAFVIHSFFQLMVGFLGNVDQLKERLRQKSKAAPVPGKIKMLIPLCGPCGYWKAGGQFTHRTSLGVFQYVFIRSTMAIITLICESVDYYHEGYFSDWTKLYPYSSIIMNTSQLWALYCLAAFYLELKHELKPISPLSKFIVIKALVFFSWWQSIIISGLVSIHKIPSTLHLTEEEVAKGLQNFLICLEMACYAIAHHWVYSVHDFYQDDKLGPVALNQAASAGEVLSSLLPIDLFQECFKHLRGGLGLQHKRAKRRREAAMSNVQSTFNPQEEAAKGVPTGSEESILHIRSVEAKEASGEALRIPTKTA